MNDIHKNICILLKYLNSWFVSGGSAGRCLWSFGVLALWLRRLRLGRARGYHQDMWPWFFSADGGGCGRSGSPGGCCYGFPPSLSSTFCDKQSHPHTQRRSYVCLCICYFFSSSLSFDCCQCTSWWPVMLYLHFLLFSSFLLFCPFFFFLLFSSVSGLVILHVYKIPIF